MSKSCTVYNIMCREGKVEFVKYKLAFYIQLTFNKWQLSQFSDLGHFELAKGVQDLSCIRFSSNAENMRNKILS